MSLFSSKFFLTVRLSVVLALLVAGYNLQATKTYAVNMNSTNYQIIFGNLNIGGNHHTSTSYNLNTSLGQTFADRFTSAGYIAKVGFQYIYTIKPFSFKISTTLINLGSLVPNIFPSPAPSLNITITNPSRGYDVQTVEDHPLQTLSLNTIPDTACNGGLFTCTKTSANVWTSTAAYGFGYNASGNDITADFVNGTYFRPFANRAVGDTPVTFMSSLITATSRVSTVTFMANVDGSQPAGTYQTVVNFIAIPKY
jgi:hypothetical protein